MAAPISPTTIAETPDSACRHRSKCSVCKHFIPSWEVHGLCVKHWATDCSPLATCSLCRDWTNDIWSQVYDLYASMTESSASNVSQQGNDLDLARIPSPGKSINSGNTIVDTGLKTTPPSNNVSKTRKKKKSKTTKLTPTAISSVKPASGKGSMISSVDNDVSNVSNIISLQASPSTCGMVEAGEVDLGVGSSHCTDQIEQPPLVPTKSPGPDLGSVVDGGGFSHLIQELVRKQVEASVAQLVQNNPSQLPYQGLTTDRDNCMLLRSSTEGCLGASVTLPVEGSEIIRSQSFVNELSSWVPPSGGPGGKIPNPGKASLGSFPLGVPGNRLNTQRHSQAMGPGLNNSAGTTLRPPVTGLKPNSAQHPSGKNVGGSYRVPSLPNSYAGTLGTGAPAVSWNRAPAPQIPQFPHPQGFGEVGGIIPIDAHNVVSGRENPVRPNITTGSLLSCPRPIQRFVTPRPHRNMYRTPYTVPNLRASAPVRFIRPTCSKSMASIAQPFSWPLSEKENMAPQEEAGREESQQYIAPGNPMHSMTYKNIEELDADEYTPQSSEKSGDQEESDYLTFSGKVEIIRQVLGEAIPKDTGDRADEAPTSLLSATKRKKEPLASLPLAQVVRGTLRSLGDEVKEQTKTFQTNSDGIIIKDTAAIMRNRRFYKSS